LIGTWKSDHAQSMHFDRTHSVLEAKQLAFLDQVLGHLVMTFKDEKVRYQMPDVPIVINGKAYLLKGSDDTYEYRVLGADEDSIAIFVVNQFGRDRILHLHFTSQDTFWIYSEESDLKLREINVREYFRRL
jgi:hypothetical protein